MHIYIRKVPDPHYDFSSEVQFNDFVSKYTIQEDKIHGLWTQIQNEQAKLVVRLLNLPVLNKITIYTF